MASLVINRGSIKLLVAIAIPVGIAYMFYSSQQAAKQEMAAYQAEQKQNPTSDSVVIKNYAMKEVDDSNHPRWQLIAGKGTILPDHQNVSLEDVNVEYYDKGTKEIKMKLIAPSGFANESSRFVRLTGVKGRPVVCESNGGKAKFECGAMELTKNDKFQASGGVIIIWPGVAKVSGNSASGSLNLGDSPKDMKVVGNTHAEISMK